MAGKSLREDQRAAFEHATAEGGLKIIEGRAGTGKSFTLAAIRDAHHEQGRGVIGLAPTNSVAEDLKADGFARASTVHAELFRLKNGRAIWDKSTVVIVDEAAMLDTRVTRELLVEARRSGAKLILAGDDRQLASIERGGLFSELKQRHGSAEITEVTRQKVDWQRQAARDLAEGNFAEAVSAFAKNGAIRWTEKQDQAREALVERWTAGHGARPAGDALRVRLHQQGRERAQRRFARGAAGTRRAVRRGRSLRDQARRRIVRGRRPGAVHRHAQEREDLQRQCRDDHRPRRAHRPFTRARLDGPQGAPGREVVWSASEFDGFRHGYAGTIYKGQGKTLDHTYLYHTEHWRQAASYVALTRQRESATIFVARETARNPKQLAWQMARGEVKSASLAWATRDELAPALRAKADAAEARAGEKPMTDAAVKAAPVSPSEAGRTAEPAKADARARPERQAGVGEGSIVAQDRALKEQRAEKSPPRDEPDWLIAPRVSPDGRDSLGRGLDAQSVSAFVANDKAVQRERQGLSTWLQTAYRDPSEATKRLDALVARDGFASAARRIERDPAQLGDYAGKTGLFAGGAAKEERANALRVAEAIGPGLARLGEAEASTARDYRAGVEKQLQADATGIPKLSERAQAAIDAARAAENRQGARRGLEGDDQRQGRRRRAEGLRGGYGETVRRRRRARHGPSRAGWREGLRGRRVGRASRASGGGRGRTRDMAAVKSGERAVEGRSSRARRRKSTQGARLKP